MAVKVTLKLRRDTDPETEGRGINQDQHLDFEQVPGVGEYIYLHGDHWKVNKVVWLPKGSGDRAVLEVG